MCGIFAILDPSGRFLGDDKLAVAEAAVAHRGPDGRGFFRSGPVALLHRRLVLIDPAGGGQPMTDPSGRWTLVLDGTIFNHAELRATLREYPFRTRSDAEVLLALLATRGVAGLGELRGEFAFVLYDAREGSFLAARDRFGAKPLHWARRDATVAFASTGRALLATGLIPPTPDHETIDDYLSFMGFRPERTFFRDIAILGPGCLARVAAGRVDFERYDGPRFAAGAPTDEEIRAAFQVAVERSLVADVPVGTFLSGGVDSTSIAAVAARCRPALPAFTVGFAGADERPRARATARELGLSLHEVEIDDSILPARLPLLVQALEAPRLGHGELNDAAAGLARGKVGVVLSGCGGDEIFGGYTPHYLPGEDQAALQAGLFRVVLEPEAKPDFYSRDLLRTAAISPAAPGDRAGRRLEAFAREAAARADASLPLQKAMAFHAAWYLPGLLLLDDAIAMSRSLALRAPFLDRDLVDLAWRLPPEEHFDGASGKKAFRRALTGLISPAVAGDAAKRGFGAPRGWMRGKRCARWIRGLFAGHLAAEPFLRPEAARRAVADYLDGTTHRSRRVWTFLNLELWARIFLHGADPERLAA